MQSVISKKSEFKEMYKTEAELKKIVKIFFQVRVSDVYFGITLRCSLVMVKTEFSFNDDSVFSGIFL